MVVNGDAYTIHAIVHGDTTMITNQRILLIDKLIDIEDASLTLHAFDHVPVNVAEPFINGILPKTMLSKYEVQFWASNHRFLETQITSCNNTMFDKIENKIDYMQKINTFFNRYHLDWDNYVNYTFFAKSIMQNRFLQKNNGTGVVRQSFVENMSSVFKLFEFDYIWRYVFLSDDNYKIYFSYVQEKEHCVEVFINKIADAWNYSYHTTNVNDDDDEMEHQHLVDSMRLFFNHITTDFLKQFTYFVIDQQFVDLLQTQYNDWIVGSIMSEHCNSKIKHLPMFNFYGKQVLLTNPNKRRMNDVSVPCTLKDLNDLSLTYERYCKINKDSNSHHQIVIVFDEDIVIRKSSFTEDRFEFTFLGTTVPIVLHNVEYTNNLPDEYDFAVINDMRINVCDVDNTVILTMFKAYFIIEENMSRCIFNPAFKMCRARLRREFNRM
jgi:hypothetical protein